MDPGPRDPGPRGPGPGRGKMQKQVKNQGFLDQGEGGGGTHPDAPGMATGGLSDPLKPRIKINRARVIGNGTRYQGKDDWKVCFIFSHTPSGKAQWRI